MECSFSTLGTTLEQMEKEKGLERKGDLYRKRKEKPWDLGGLPEMLSDHFHKRQMSRAQCRCIKIVFEDTAANVFHSEWNSIPYYLERKLSHEQCTL